MAVYLSSPSFFLFFSSILIVLDLSSYHVLADLILEDGYTVTTLMDGHKLKINPYSVLSRPQSSDLIILDYSQSRLYTVSLPVSQESELKQFSGDGTPGLSDGEPGLARFNKPRSFTVDNRGNIYVAERSNGTIRKITNSGVSTIAGGYLKGLGHEDGPAQNATFSNDFEVAFVPEECALLISDHGNQLVRRLSLKPEDCAADGSQSAVGAVSYWVLGFGLVLSCSIGIAIGFAIRPYITPREGSSPLHCSKTWRLFLISLVKPLLMLCFDIRSAVASSRSYEFLRRFFWLSLSHLSLMFRINTVCSQTSRKVVDSQTVSKGFVSLLDSDVNISEMETLQLSADLKDLISFDGYSGSSNSKNEISKMGEQDQSGNNLSLDGNRGIDTMIQANITGFAKAAEEITLFDKVSLVESRGLVKRR